MLQICRQCLLMKHSSILFYRPLDHSSRKSCERFLRTASRSVSKINQCETKELESTIALQNINPNEHTTDAKQCVNILKHYYQEIKENKMEYSAKKNEIEPLYDQIFKNVRKLNLNEIVLAFNILSYFRIPSNTMIMQSLLQMIRMSINDLSPRQIIHIHILLTKQRETILGNAIQKSLPVVFHYAIVHQLRGEDIDLLASALVYSIYNKLPEKKIMFISNLIEENISQLTPSAARRIVRAMEDKHKPLLFCKNITFKSLQCLGKKKGHSYDQITEYFHLIFPKSTEFTENEYKGRFLSSLNEEEEAQQN